jgi:hypothetical protein
MTALFEQCSIPEPADTPKAPVLFTGIPYGDRQAVSELLKWIAALGGKSAAPVVSTNASAGIVKFEEIRLLPYQCRHITDTLSKLNSEDVSLLRASTDPETATGAVLLRSVQERPDASEEMLRASSGER